MTNVMANPPLSSSGGVTPTISLGTVDVTKGGTGLTATSLGSILIGSGTGAWTTQNCGINELLMWGASGSTSCIGANVSNGYAKLDASGNLGVGTSSPAAKLDVQGEVKIGNTSLACGSSTEGALRYNSTTKRMEFCNGTNWSQISAGTLASVAIGSPSQSIVKSGPVTFLVTYGSGTDTATINLNSGNISFSGTDFTGCSVTGVANTSANTRTVTVNGCTGTGTVAISIAANTATSTTGDPAASAGPSTSYTVDNVGPAAPTGVTLGSVPNSLSSTPTISYSATTDSGGSSVASYQVQILRTSDSAVISTWSTHTSGNAVTGLSLSPSTQYSVLVRALDALGNIGAQSVAQNWTTISGFPLTVTLSSNTTNYNIRNAAIAAGWDQVIPVIANITINAGVAVYSTSSSTPALVTGVLTAGSTITITNNGSILGQPGATYSAANYTDPSGPAMQIDYPTTIINNGIIAGGAGAGGSNEGDACGGCGGGNGGTSGGNGGAGIVFNANAAITNNCSLRLRMAVVGL
ncbi:MAG: hypothetical protein BroJett040_24160 [Oligoflexia bacterium]|nr:MAG: hypothetical protein BroJett040_24160 [Oligoflexia bacterium]